MHLGACILLLGYQFVLISCQPGFTSLACGAATAFTDQSTGISWSPDSTRFVTTGLASAATGGSGSSLRYFPPSPGSRNLDCFEVPVPTGLHLTRATFTYGNYDKLQRAPSFAFVLNQTVISNVNLEVEDPWVEEVVWNSSGGTTNFCVLANNGTAPAISSLEVRPLPQSAYAAAMLGSKNALLRRKLRLNCGETLRTFRYPNDTSDRIWDTDRYFTGLTAARSYGGFINTSSDLDAPPVAVLQTSRASSTSILSYVADDVSDSGEHFIVLHFTGIGNTTSPRSLNIFVDGAVQQQAKFSFPPKSMAASYSLSSTLSSRFNLTLQSQSSPEINALELYKYVELALPTSDTDAASLTAILSLYGVSLPWKYDPCLPVAFGEITCTNSPRPEVTSLQLSAKGLEGAVYPLFADFAELAYLNLSHNQLSGNIPEELNELAAIETLDLSFNTIGGPLPDLSHLQSLKTLNLQNNMLSGPIPDYLAQLGSLELVNIMNNNFTGPIPPSLAGKIQVAGNPCLGSLVNCPSQSGQPPASSPRAGLEEPFAGQKNKRSSSRVIAGVSVGSAVVAALILGICFLVLCNNKSGSSVNAGSGSSPLPVPAAVTGFFRTHGRAWGNCREFSYKELDRATNGFRKELGRGGFGPVYYGKLADGQEVAIKVRADSSRLGAESFMNEVDLLSQVHHQNLVPLIGFCQSSKKQLLVYEFMAGTLTDYLYGAKSQTTELDWKTRISIAAGAAAALDYLHNGSVTKIIHRDVKSANILIDARMTAKVADFGLSKNMNRVDATHVTTVVKGTPGYLDPEYFASNQLTEKSDVFSFGVVLLEIICGREPLSSHVPPEQHSLVTWARPLLQVGAYADTVDRSILGKFNPMSMGMVVDLACSAVERDPASRPSMNQVVRKLQQALEIEGM